MSDATKMNDLLRLDQEVLIVTGIRPAVFDEAGNCTDAGLDIAVLQPDGTYQGRPTRTVKAVVLVPQEDNDG